MKDLKPRSIRIAIDGINVGTNPSRPLDEEEVKRLAVSMKRIGLMTPITVRYYPETLGPDGADDAHELIAGRHRFAAAVSLGWDEIDAIVIECSDVDAKLWEIAENLHRAELTQLERSEQVAEWIRLTGQSDRKPQGGRPEGGIAAAARDLGIQETDAKRSVRVDSLSDEAKAAAVKHHLDDNRSALLQAARESDPENQVAKIVELAVKKTKPKPAPIEASKEEAEAIEFFVEADVAGSAATNKLIKKVVDFFESLDAAFTALMENNPEQEATEALLGAVYAFANDLRRRAYQPIYKKRRADNKIDRAYSKQFGAIAGVIDRDRINLMAASLASGTDQLADEKRKQKEHHEQREREHEEFLVTPITPEMEHEYTAMIKQRTLYEGACMLAWQMYFKYRDEHPDLPPLSPDDLEYAGMWTACAVRPLT
jgi:ParB-like chromosome segregation protein Spo0J